MTHPGKEGEANQFCADCGHGKWMHGIEHRECADQELSGYPCPCEGFKPPKEHRLARVGANGQSVRIMQIQGEGVEIDSEIYELVYALNIGGSKTVACCSGHVKRLGNIALEDGRELIIMPSYEAARLDEKRRAALEDFWKTIGDCVISGNGETNSFSNEASEILREKWQAIAKLDALTPDPKEKEEA